MKMREVVKQQPRDQRAAHWQRLLGYLHEANYQLPDVPRQWPPDPGDELRNESERGTEESDVNIFCRGEQNGQGADDLARNQDRSKVVQQVWRDALTKLCLDRQMPWQGTCASNVRSRESSSRTMVSLQNCAGEIPVRQEGTGAQNLAEQSCQQRIDLQQADGRLQSQAQSQVPGVKLTGTINFELLDSECIQLLERSSGQRAKIANVDNEDKSTIGVRSLESQ
jgi:hypothetical protein